MCNFVEATKSQLLVNSFHFIVYIVNNFSIIALPFKC